MKEEKLMKKISVLRSKQIGIYKINLLLYYSLLDLC